jgi:hypothetical protein
LRQREHRPAWDAFGRTENTNTSLVVGLRPRVVSVWIVTSSITMFWSPRPVANTLDMRNAVAPLRLEPSNSPKRKQDAALRPKPQVSRPTTTSQEPDFAIHY